MDLVILVFFIDKLIKTYVLNPYCFELDVFDLFTNQGGLDGVADVKNHVMHENQAFFKPCPGCPLLLGFD